MIFIIGGSVSGKTNVLLNLIKHQQLDAGKTYLYVKDLFESKFQLLINRTGKLGLNMKKIQRHLLIIHKQLVTSMKI